MLLFPFLIHSYSVEMPDESMHKYSIISSFLSLSFFSSILHIQESYQNTVEHETPKALSHQEFWLTWESSSVWRSSSVTEMLPPPAAPCAAAI